MSRKELLGLFLGLTASFAPSYLQACIDDCDGDARVSPAEQRLAVDVALATAPSSACDAADNDRDGAVTVEELVLGALKRSTGCGSGVADVRLYSSQNNQLDLYDVATGTVDTLVPSTREHVNGQVCLVPGGDGEFIAGTDTEQPRLRPGWGLYSPDGTFLRKIELPPHEGDTADPIGCAFDAQGRLFASAIGTQGGADGQLIVYFPPRFQESCILDDTLRTPGSLAIDDEGNVYVPEGLPPGKVQRFAAPFPSTASECGGTPTQRSAFIEYDDLVSSLAVARGPDGHWFVSQVFGLAGAGPTIREHAADGTYLRDIVPPGRGGNPTGLAVDAGGTVYYADLGLNQSIPPQTVPRKGTVRKVGFDPQGEPLFPETIGRGLSFPDGVGLLPRRPAESRTLGGSPRRTYFFPLEKQITPATVSQLVPKWRYTTNAIITASPAVALVDLPGEGPTLLVVVPSWDGRVYALRASNGRRVWSFTMKPQPGGSFPFSSSATVARVGGRQMVFVGGGMTVYALDAADGDPLWEFDAGTGCTTCGFDDEESELRERNEVLSTPAVHEGLVYFGMDIDDGGRAKGGLYAVDASDGRLVWYFDLVTSSTCRPLAADAVHRFDGYHTAAELGLPEDFFATRPGCDFDRTGNTCGNVWSSIAVDARRGLLYTASSNCDTDDDPSTPEAPPPMPPYDEAIFAVTLEGEPAWVWRPREVDNGDLAFGAVPNLFEIVVDGVPREVVGVGNKDGTYYVLDRDGVNEISGEIEPYWATQTVAGGPIGGIIASAAVGPDGVFFGTAIGFTLEDPQKPSAWGLELNTGELRWSNDQKLPGFGATTGVPGIAFTGELASAQLWAYDTDTGARLARLDTFGRPGGAASAAVIADGVLYVGGGVGARGGRPAEQGFVASESDSPLSAFCLRDTPGCDTNAACDDADPCTYDYRDGAGCGHEPSPDGLDCRADGVDGACSAGACVVP